VPHTQAPKSLGTRRELVVMLESSFDLCYLVAVQQFWNFRLQQSPESNPISYLVEFKKSYSINRRHDYPCNSKHSWYAVIMTGDRE